MDFYEILFIYKLLNHGFVGLWVWVLKDFVYILDIYIYIYIYVCMYICMLGFES